MKTSQKALARTKWWEAVVISESYGQKSIGLYIWQKRDDVWKRKHKFNVRNLEEWSKLARAMIYLLAIGLITLTLGIVREFYAVILKP